jgi:hypothetical protein
VLQIDEDELEAMVGQIEIGMHCLTIMFVTKVSELVFWDSDTEIDLKNSSPPEAMRAEAYVS